MVNLARTTSSVSQMKRNGIIVAGWLVWKSQTQIQTGKFHFYSKCKHKFRSFRHDFWYFTSLVDINLGHFTENFPMHIEQNVGNLNHWDTVKTRDRDFLVCLSVHNPIEWVRFDLAIVFISKIFAVSVCRCRESRWYSLHLHTNELQFKQEIYYRQLNLANKTLNCVSRFAYLLWLRVEHVVDFFPFFRERSQCTNVHCHRVKNFWANTQMIECCVHLIQLAAT